MDRNRELIETQTRELVEPQFFVIHVLWQRRGRVLLGFCLGLAIAALYYSVVPPRYEASTQIMFINKGQQTVPGLNTPLLSADDNLAIHEATITSPIVIQKAVETAHLHRLASLKNEDDTTRAIIERLKTGAVATSGQPTWSRSPVIELAYRCTSDEDCRIVLESIIASYQDYLKQSRENDNSTARKLFKQWSNEIQLELTAKQQAFRKLLEESPTLVWRDDRAVSLGQDQLTQIEAQKMSNLIRLTEAEEKLRSIETARAAGVEPRALDQLAFVWGVPVNDMAAMQQQYYQLLSEEQSLLVKYGPKHPEILAIRRQIDLLREELPDAPETKDGNSRPSSVLTHTLKQEREVAKQLLDAFSSQIEKAQALAKQNGDGMVEITQLHRDITGMQELYKDIARQVRGTDLVEDTATFEAVVIAPPDRGDKVSPNPWLLGTVGTFLGLLIGGGLSFVAEISDQSIRSLSEVRRRLGAGVVGLIPPVRCDRRRRLVSEPEEQTPDLTVWAFHKPDSFESECIRGLRTSLVLARRCDGNSVIQITSPNSGDGKSTIAANLATSLAQSNHSVLLMEADFRSPSMQTRLPVFNPDVGLATVLAGKAVLEEAIQTTGVSGLSVLPSGRILGNPAELLTGSELHEVLLQIRQQFDFVLIDAPPLLAVSDAWMIVPYVDSVLLVLGPNSQWPQVMRAKDVLKSLHTHTFGVVLNGMDFHEDESIYGSGGTIESIEHRKLEHRPDTGATATPAHERSTA